MGMVTLEGEFYYQLVGEALICQGELTGDYSIVAELTIIAGIECNIVADENGTYITIEG